MHAGAMVPEGGPRSPHLKQWMASRSYSIASASNSDPYKVLGVDRNVDAEAVKKAYRKLALKWHPDRNTDNKEEAELQFKRISEAYQLLSDAGRRSIYDRTGSDRSGAFGSSGAAGATTGPLSREEAEAIFKSMFGDKPVHEIVRELELQLKQQEAVQDAQQRELSERAQRLRTEALELQTAASRESQPFRRANLVRQALQKAMQADQADQQQQMMGLQHLQQRLQQRAAVAQIKKLDPKEQAIARREYAIKSSFSWGFALGAYFVWGYTWWQALLVFIVSRFVVRVVLASARLRRSRVE